MRTKKMPEWFAVLQVLVLSPPPSFVGPLLFEGFRGGVTKCWLGMLRNDAVLQHICRAVTVASLCHTFTVFMGICECTARPAPPLLLQVAFY